MRYFLAFVTLLVISIAQAQAAPQLGITPCTINGQPSDLTLVTNTSGNRQMSKCGETVIVYNNSATDLRYRLGTSSTTAALATDLLLPANSFVVLNVGTQQMYFAAISTGTPTISFVQGTAGN